MQGRGKLRSCFFFFFFKRLQSPHPLFVCAKCDIYNSINGYSIGAESNNNGRLRSTAGSRSNAVQSRNRPVHRCMASCQRKPFCKSCGGDKKILNLIADDLKLIFWAYFENRVEHRLHVPIRGISFLQK